MSCCEKCWGDAYMRAMVDGRSQAEHYQELIIERMGKPCTPEQQKYGNVVPEETGE